MKNEKWEMENECVRCADIKDIESSALLFWLTSEKLKRGRFSRLSIEPEEPSLVTHTTLVHERQRLTYNSFACGREKSAPEEVGASLLHTGQVAPIFPAR